MVLSGAMCSTRRGDVWCSAGRRVMLGRSAPRGIRRVDTEQVGARLSRGAPERWFSSARAAPVGPAAVDVFPLGSRAAPRR